MKALLVWIKIVLPPLFLLPLFFIFFDLTVSSILWVFAFIVFMKPVVSLAKAFFRLLRENELFKKELIRPFLSIVVIIISVSNIVTSQNTADALALRIANLAQEQYRWFYRIRGGVENQIE